MLSMLSGLPADLLSFMGTNFSFFVGYGVCVLFPMPWLNSWIIDLWKKLLSTKTITVTTPPPPAA